MLERPVSIVADVVVPVFITRPPDEPPLSSRVPVNFKPDADVKVLPDTTSDGTASPKSEALAVSETVFSTMYLSVKLVEIIIWLGLVLYSGVPGATLRVERVPVIFSAFTYAVLPDTISPAVAVASDVSIPVDPSYVPVSFRPFSLLKVLPFTTSLTVAFPNKEALTFAEIVSFTFATRLYLFS